MTNSDIFVQTILLSAFTINVQMQRKGKCERCDYNCTRKSIVNFHSLLKHAIPWIYKGSGGVKFFNWLTMMKMWGMWMRIKWTKRELKKHQWRTHVSKRITIGSGGYTFFQFLYKQHWLTLCSVNDENVWNVTTNLMKREN